MLISNSKNVIIKNIRAGHLAQKGLCSGGVFKIIKSSDIQVDNCELFGCGTYGLDLENVKDLRLDNSVIKECSYGAMYSVGCRNILFNNSEISKNTGYDLIQIGSGSNYKFTDCRFLDNDNSISETASYSMFWLTSSNDVNIIDSKIEK